MMGNAGAAKRHEASADEHVQQATQHTMTANEIFAQKQAEEAGSLPTANDQADEEGSEGSGSLPKVDADWDESAHPRGEGGKFGSGASEQTPKTPAGIRPATANEFHAAFAAATANNPYAAYVTNYTKEQLAGMKLFVSADGKAGIAVHDHGDGRVEGTALFNNGAAKGSGIALLQHAVEHAGANYVECFGPRLNQLYASLGFKQSTKDAFNADYAPKNWDHERDDSPDYYTMRI
jgi:hypothetical protein